MSYKYRVTTLNAQLIEEFVSLHYALRATKFAVKAGLIVRIEKIEP